MGKVYFLFGVHNHQPVGNFGYVFEKAFNDCYAPFIDVLEKYPRIKCNLHISGPLWDWIYAHRRDFISKLSVLIHRGQLEIASGGYYEPVLPIIPEHDMFLQIKKMNTFIEKHFDVKPSGIWTAERVWEPYLARIIHDAGLQYTFLDDAHFRSAGLDGGDFLGYYTTEDSGKAIAVFPISKILRYKIPFSKAPEAIELIKSFRQEKDVLVTMFDDGEKFGFWPHTFDWVYTKGWLDSFFKLLDKNIDNIETITAREATERFTSKGLLYFPTGSYEEMGEWVLMPHHLSLYDKVKEFIAANHHAPELAHFARGGFFRNFCVKYPRLNFMHKKMLSVSRMMHERGMDKEEDGMLTSLLMAQCNCGYWHGVFGGFYLGHIRAAIYENIIRAEKQFDARLKAGLDMERFDIDFDGAHENVIKNEHFTVTVSDRGGAIKELSLKSCDYNLLNTITRRPEAYHAKIHNKERGKRKLFNIHDLLGSKQEGLKDTLIYDSYEKLALIDHIVPRAITAEDFIAARNITTLSHSLYAFALNRTTSAIDLQYSYGGPEVSFSKTLSFSSQAHVRALYRFSSRPTLQNYDFGVEFNIFLQSPDNIRFIAQNQETGFCDKLEYRDIDRLGIKDLFKRICCDFTFSPSRVFVAPLYTVSSSEAGFEKAYQQVMILFIPKVGEDTFRFALEVAKL